MVVRFHPCLQKALNMSTWKKIDQYDEASMPPVGLKVIVLSDDGIPYISERETDALGVYCGLYCDEGYAEWWIEIPTK